MLSDEDSRFRESWKERGESHKLCCLLTLWGRIEITLSFEILCYGLVQCILCYSMLFLSVKILRYYIVCIWKIIGSKITLLFNILYCIPCCFFFFYIIFAFDYDAYSIFLYYSLDRILNFKNAYVIYMF